jgi:hypothetical protein
MEFRGEAEKKREKLSNKNIVEIYNNIIFKNKTMIGIIPIELVFLEIKPLIKEIDGVP